MDCYANAPQFQVLFSIVRLELEILSLASLFENCRCYRWNLSNLKALREGGADKEEEVDRDLLSIVRVRFAASGGQENSGKSLVDVTLCLSSLWRWSWVFWRVVGAIRWTFCKNRANLELSLIGFTTDKLRFRPHKVSKFNVTNLRSVVHQVPDFLSFFCFMKFIRPLRYYLCWVIELDRGSWRHQLSVWKLPKSLRLPSCYHITTSLNLYYY